MWICHEKSRYGAGRSGNLWCASAPRPAGRKRLRRCWPGRGRPRFCQLRNSPQSVPCASGRMAAGACPLPDCYRPHLTACELQNNCNLVRGSDVASSHAVNAAARVRVRQDAFCYVISSYAGCVFDRRRVSCVELDEATWGVSRSRWAQVASGHRTRPVSMPSARE
jgi:hypothetical protein